MPYASYNIVNNQLYLEWLYKTFKPYTPDFDTETSYKYLYSTLYGMEFRYIIPFDVNRKDDGLYLRWDFSDSESVVRSLSPTANVLEVIAALAVRWDRTMMAPPELGPRETRFRIWMAEMLSNIGLLGYDDWNWNMDTESAVKTIIENWMDRCIDYDGTGGLFPISQPKRDQRTIELWGQMNDYMSEKLSS